MPRSWSEAVKACREHQGKANGRACACRVGWRYRLGLPDPVTGLRGRPEWSSTFPTKEQADRHQRDTRRAIDEGTFAPDRGLTVGELLDEVLARMMSKGRKASTVTGYRGVIETRLKPMIGHHRVAKLTQHHVQAMLDRIAAEPSLSRGRGHLTVSAGTLVNIRAVLRAALNDAMRRGLVVRNVATLVELPPAKRPAPVAIDDDRLSTWLDHVERQGDLLAPLWLAVSVYGPRRGELLGLRWDDVSTSTKLVHVRQELVDVAGLHPCSYCGGAHQRLLFDTPKSAAGERSWPLVPKVEAALMAHRLRQDDDRAMYGRDYLDHRLVFAQPDGLPWRPDWVSREFRRTFKASGAAAGMDRAPSLKALRSTATTALSAEGVPLELVSKLTGHAGQEVTRRHYLAVNAERVRGEYEAIAARRGGGRSDRRSDRGPESTGERRGGGDPL